MVGPPGGDNRKETIEYFKDFVRFDDDQETNDSSFTAEYECDMNCDAPGRLALQVVPERNAHKVNWRLALANPERRGYVVAKLTNVSKRRFGPLDLEPGSTIYQWVGPVDVKQDSRRIAWIKINPATGEAGRFMQPRKKVRTCTLEGAEKRTRSKVAYAADHVTSNCPKWPPSLVGETAEADAPDRSAALLTFLYPPGMWNSCEGGCCSAEY
jgi:hypothetical protein